MQSNHFNVRELIAVCVLTTFIVALSIPMSEADARSSRRMQNSTQLRGIHQGLVTHANSNKNWFAGIDTKGNDAGILIEQRYQILMEDDYFTPEYAVSPYDTGNAIHEWSGQGSVIEDNYSFAMLQVPQAGARREEWKQTLNSQSVVLSDRNTGTEMDTYGYHNDRWESSSTLGCTHNQRQPYLNINHWVGNVLWNDNHLEFVSLDTLDTQYDNIATTGDNLFRTVGTDDAQLIHRGN